MEASDIHIGKQLQVSYSVQGATPNPPLAYGFGPTAVPGTGFFNGGVMVGNPLNFPIPNVPEATMMVGRAEYVSNPLAAAAPSIFKISNKGSLVPPTPIDVVLGEPGKGVVGISINSLNISIFNNTNISIISPYTTGVGVLNWVGAKTLTGVENLTGSKAQAGAEARSGPKIFNGYVQVNGFLKSNVCESIISQSKTCKADLGVFKSLAAPYKEFDIPHPSKPGWRLRHTCLEGPEIGVYYRGKLVDNNIIELPEYWKDLVDLESITVNLTPHECYQELFVKKIEWGTKVIIQNNSGGPINCSYVVYAERKDVDKIEIEYKEEE